ncbi:MAG TPA: hypothetical protein VFM25_11395 [Verrucomicrobiae bacterium]|nr:hypothetical protein [Verrucomicrobiae bacterium]
MKTIFKMFAGAAFFSAAIFFTQECAFSQNALGVAKSTGDFTSDMAVIREAQEQSLEQAKQMLERGGNPNDRVALETAIKQMEQAQKALEEARHSPEKLSAALAAQQAAYQALLKLAPREFRVNQSRNRGQSGNSAGQPNQRQLDQLQMTREENRYETERQAESAPTQQQRERSKTADRLKELAQRQQDLNDRLRELQTSLQAAQTEKERDEIQRELKRLRDEERQMLANLDELRQQMDQSPDANETAQARQQLDRTRSEMERAAREMENQSPSQALAAGTRAQQNMQTMRDNFRQQSASQFSEQMRQMRSQARELAQKQDEITRKLDSMENGNQKSLDTSAEQQKLADELARQQTGLTNLLSNMRAVTEQSENAEPLLSRQLYDTLRRADQARTGNLLDMSAQLAERGFLPQAAEAGRAAGTNINQIRRSVERAAESVLGSETESLRYAQRELDNLEQQIQSEIAGGQTNAPGIANSNSNQLAQLSAPAESQNRVANTNRVAVAAPGDTNETQIASNNSEQRQRENTPRGSEQPGGNSPAQNRNGNRNGENGRPENNSERGIANNNSNSTPAQNGSANSGSAQNGNRDGTQTAQNGGGENFLREFVEQLGRGGGAGGSNNGGPITGNGFVDWSDRMRDVERVLDSEDLRNQLATVRERVATYRSEFRQGARLPRSEVLQDQILTPLTQVRFWLREELARRENANSLVPLDRDPVPEKYSELVRKYYETLGSAK